MGVEVDPVLDLQACADRMALVHVKDVAAVRSMYDPFLPPFEPPHDSGGQNQREQLEKQRRRAWYEIEYEGDER